MFPSSLSPTPVENRRYVDIQQLPHALDLPLPAYATPSSAGLDLYAAVEDEVVLAPGTWQTVSTGIAIGLPSGYEAQIRSRSGLAARHGVVVLNSPGTIDADYRGEIKVILINHGKEPFIITRGMRFAQMVIAAFTGILWNEETRLNETYRGVDGFGSTGIR